MHPEVVSSTDGVLDLNAKSFLRLSDYWCDDCFRRKQRERISKGNLLCNCGWLVDSDGGACTCTALKTQVNNEIATRAIAGGFDPCAGS